MAVTRDFIGYGDHPAKVEWPGNARLAVDVAVNFEEGAEWCIEYGDLSCEHRGIDPGGATRRPQFESGDDASDTRRDLLRRGPARVRERHRVLAAARDPATGGAERVPLSPAAWPSSPSGVLSSVRHSNKKGVDRCWT